MGNAGLLLLLKLIYLSPYFLFAPICPFFIVLKAVVPPSTIITFTCFFLGGILNMLLLPAVVGCTYFFCP